MGRYYLAIDTPLAQCDDVALGVISILRVEQGNESIRIGHVNLPVTNGWEQVQIEYFGTIGNSKYEAQSKKNRALIADALAISLHEWSGKICFSFQLSNQRKDRDLDNLVDAIVPVITKTVDPFDHMIAIKEYFRPESNEMFRVSSNAINILFKDTS